MEFKIGCHDDNCVTRRCDIDVCAVSFFEMRKEYSFIVANSLTMPSQSLVFHLTQSIVTTELEMSVGEIFYFLFVISYLSGNK